MGISATQLGILLLIVVIIFGTRKLRGMGEDIGFSLKGFRKGMSEDDDE